MDWGVSDSFEANSNLNKEGMHNIKDGTAKIHQDSNINCETETENKEVGTNFALSEENMFLLNFNLILIKT